MVDERVQSALTAVRRVLSRRPSGIFADIDGTLSPIAPSPEQAIVPEGTRRALAKLALRVDLVAAITGRSVADARRFVRADGLVYVGNHGLERWESSRTWTHVQARPYVALISQTLAGLRDRLTIPGVRYEDKGATATIHYRRATDPSAARAAILEALDGIPSAASLRVSGGRMVVNLLPPVVVDKGRAIAELAEERELVGVVFLGDDVTDFDGFRTLRELRETRAITTLSIGVLSPEAPAELVEATDVHLESVDEVEALLVALASESEPRA
jgi:trehalose 6-phosphate phosphatase